jgi:hypothetical protein
VQHPRRQTVHARLSEYLTSHDIWWWFCSVSFEKDCVFDSTISVLVWSGWATSRKPSVKVVVVPARIR